MSDTIFALSSGSPPAAIGIIRVSGPLARAAAAQIAGRLPAPRKAGLRSLRGPQGHILDEALVLWFPGPDSATGEDLVELHCHGGRAVVRAVEAALGGIEGLREARAGEFTRRAFANGRIDLAQAEGLADLLAAETELQRRAAQASLDGVLSRQVGVWRDLVLQLAAQVEAVLDFSDEEDAEALPDAFHMQLATLCEEMQAMLVRPAAERLREGIRIVLAGPPNSGKSTLFNCLVRDSAAITSPLAGTTRDIIERPVALGGVPLLLVDTAGLREQDTEEIEAQGIARARAQLERADLVLWLGPEGEGPEGAVEIQPRSDAEDCQIKRQPDYAVSAETGEGMAELEAGLVARARAVLPKPGDVALSERQRILVGEATDTLAAVQPAKDLLAIAEDLRQVRMAFDRLLGRASTEDMLDALFARFCIGK